MSATAAMRDDERGEEPSVLPVALSLAVGLHAAIAAFSPHAARPPAIVRPPLEIDLSPPQRAMPPPPAFEPRDPPPAKEAPRRAAPAKTPAPAAAGKLVAAVGPPTDHDAPLDFVTDPSATSYGFGIVSRGGTGDGLARASEPPKRTPFEAHAASQPPLAPAEDLSEKPHLLVDDPCRGYYPEGATVDHASAVIRAVLDAEGRVREVVLVSEAPAGEGFGAAARRCFRDQRFSPAVDRAGRNVPTATTIRVRFER